MHDRSVDGRRIVVEFAREARSSKAVRGGKYRCTVEGLDNHTSWQDLKDFARKAGHSVVFTDVFMDRGERKG